MAHRDVPCRQLTEAETRQRDLHLLLGRLDELTAQVPQHVEAREWSRNREISRTLVKRVALAGAQVQVVFRVDAFLGEGDAENTSVPLCQRSAQPTALKDLPREPR
jgi:hypothetical protein